MKLSLPQITAGKGQPMAYFGLVEAGGTKCIAAIADAQGQLLDKIRLPTTTPDETLPALVAWIAARLPQPEAIGIAAFGPLELNRNAAQWGHILQTTKPGWSGADFVGPFQRAFDCPIGLETDVNGAALAESLWGAGRDAQSLLYLTIGTGIGGGFVTNGTLLQGFAHPEMGHMRLQRHPEDIGFDGNCPFHGDCLEGLAAGPSHMQRWGKSLSDLPNGPERERIAWYLAQAIATLRAILQPERIVLGGGVMGTPGLIDQVRTHAHAACGGYFPEPKGDVIVLPGLGEDAGIQGALAIACAAASIPL